MRVRDQPQPRDKGTVYFTLYSRPDKHGNQTFTMDWWMKDFHLGPCWRSQYFFCNPEPYVTKYTKAGLKVKITSRVLP